MNGKNLVTLIFILLLSCFSFRSAYSQYDIQIGNTNQPPLIDGQIDNIWNNSNSFSLEKIISGSPVIASDLSVSFKTFWDEIGLYVLVDVNDDSKINDSGEVWQDDAVEIYIDINNDKGESYGNNDFQYTFRWNDATIHSNNGGTEGIQFAMNGIASGYVLEVMFPWATMGLSQAVQGTALGFDVQVHDDDDGDVRDNKISWFASTDNSWQYPYLFASAQLQGEIIPDQVNLQLPSTNAVPTIDGNVDVFWADIQAKPIANVISGNAVPQNDFSGSFKTAWDATSLYVLVEVTDDVKINDSGEIWNDDAVEVYIDIDNNKLPTYGANDYGYTFRWNDPNIYNAPSAGVVFNMKGTATGYLLEVKFPWATLGLSSPRSGVYLGFDVQVHDDDDGGNRDTKFAWFGTNDNSWQDPSLFASARLVGDVAVTYPADKPYLSVDHGFFDAPFNVTITSEIPGMTIYYTLDGSDPATSVDVFTGTAPVNVRIDPESNNKRGITPAVVLRARAKKDGYEFSAPVTSTYLFVNKMNLQTTAPGHRWPTWNVNGQAIDLQIDSRILNDNLYKNLIDDAFLEVPSVSLATNYENLFDEGSGIYVNAMNARGEEWERPTSLELINPDGSKGFQIDAGLRIRGGWSRNSYFPKHAFRLFFRSEYGEGKLNFPLFGDEGTKSFDKIDLRCAQNYSWSKPDNGEAPEYTFTRDVFSRDLQREMQNPYTRSRYYHLYINGLYWGLYQSQERSEAKYAESYFGGNADNYDVIKRVGNEGRIEATDGSIDSWREVWNLCERGFSTNSNYYKLQGLNPNGVRDPSLKVLVDIDNLIDYINVIFYTGNFDAPVSSFGDNKGPNNFYAIYDRTGEKGYQFFAHDNEHTLLFDPIGPGFGVLENRVNIGSITTNMRMEVSGFDQFHPQWLHFKLSENAEYRMRFADRATKYYFDNGVLTPAEVTKLFLSRAAEIDTAVIAESARWGDVNNSWSPYTKDNAWVLAVNKIVNRYFPVRTDIVISQLKEEGLLPSVSAPVFTKNSIPVVDEQSEFSPSEILSISNTSGGGSIKYTLDGKDPRLTGGGVAPSAVDGASLVNISVLQTCIVKARVLNNGNWSALRELKIFVDEQTAGIQITEIHYNPLSYSGISGNEYEFLELKNNSPLPVNLTASKFIDGIQFSFNNETILEPGGFIVIASSAFSFNRLYGFQPFGEYEGQLDNKGERITMVNLVGDTIITLKYNDKAPWPTSPDSLGFSLVPAVDDIGADWSDGANWRASSAIGGSPNADDPFIAIQPVLISEVLTNPGSTSVDAIELYNPNSTAAEIGGWYLSDSRKTPKKWKIPAGTRIPANSYLVFNEGHYQGSTLAYNTNEFGQAFGLSSNGDDIYIFSANATEALTGYEHGFDYGAIEEGVTFGRYINSLGKEHFVAQTSSTLGARNSNPRVGPIVFNQIMYNPQSDQYEYLELVNISGQDVKLFHEQELTPWKVEGINFSFPTNVTLKPGQSVYLVESRIAPNDFRYFFNLDAETKVYNFDGSLKNEGEEITLFKPASQYVEDNIPVTPYIRIDKVDYNDNENWPDADGNGYVLMRITKTAYGNDPINWVASPPSIKIKSFILPAIVQYVPYQVDLDVSGGTAPYLWNVISGSLPSGLELNSSSGELSGTATGVGSYSFTVKVEDVEGSFDTLTYRMEVRENSLPLAVNDTVSTVQGIAIVVDILKNDMDNDGDKSIWTVEISGQPNHGSVLIADDKTISYTPTPSFIGSDEFSYRVTDPKGSSYARVFVDVADNQIVSTFERRIQSGSDDAEQNLSTLELLLTSSDVDLTYDIDYSRDQLVGLRFSSIDIPHGLTIRSAYVQFKTDKVSTVTADLTIQGEKAVSSVPFSTSSDIISRQRTASLVNWQPEEWNVVAEEAEKQRTSDISSILQEIIDQPDWNAGNAISILISGTGSHAAQSFERDPAGAAKLVVTYSNSSSEVATPVAVIQYSGGARKGETVVLDASMSYSSDKRMLNYYWVLSEKPAGSNASISNNRAVRPSFTPDLYGSYTVTLKVDNGIKESEVVSSTFNIQNQVPVANAGTDQHQAIGSLVRLNGSGSADADGDVLSYQWNIVSKPQNSLVQLSSTSVVSPSFTADKAGTYIFSLVVSDSEISSVADEVIINVAENQAPLANAGNDTDVITGRQVTLDGSQSSDPEGEKLVFSWILTTKPSGSTAALSGSTTSKPVLLPDVAGAYTITLTVTDIAGNQTSDVVVITAVDNNAPVAIAGEDITINAGLKVTLDGSESYDPEGKTIYFQWSLVSKPEKSNANLSGVNTSQPYITPDVSGLYVFRLRVSDGVYTSEDMVQVNALRTNEVIVNNISESLKTYPNPFTDKIVVEYFADSYQQVRFSVYTISGALVDEFSYHSVGKCTQVLDLENSLLNPGMYLLVMTPEKGSPRSIKLHKKQ
ncbi:MAG: cadherin-like domain-containing protein [Bacteroidales bacterium]|nr:cadherin-like domain-containing protein [Bacteroidales bacterium]